LQRYSFVSELKKFGKFLWIANLLGGKIDPGACNSWFGCHKFGFQSCFLAAPFIVLNANKEPISEWAQGG
jgi:hypothetical protein